MLRDSDLASKRRHVMNNNCSENEIRFCYHFKAAYECGTHLCRHSRHVIARRMTSGIVWRTNKLGVIYYPFQAMTQLNAQDHAVDEGQWGLTQEVDSLGSLLIFFNTLTLDCSIKNLESNRAVSPSVFMPGFFVILLFLCWRYMSRLICLLQRLLPSTTTPARTISPRFRNPELYSVLLW